MATKIRASNLHTDVTTLIQSLGGSSSLDVLSKTDNYTISTGDNGKLIVLTSGTGKIFTLPSASSAGSGWYVKIQNQSGNSMTVNKTGSDTLNNGATSFVLSNGGAIELVSNGSSLFYLRDKSLYLFAEHNRNNGSFAPTATGLSSIAIGRSASATGQTSLALGTSSSFNGSVAIGSSSVAIAGSYASGADSFAASTTNNTSSYGATGANSIAIGSKAKSTGIGSVAIGYGDQNGAPIASGDASFAIINGIATKSGSIAMGRFNTYGSPTASGLGAIAIGDGNTASATRSVALGNDNTSSHIDAIVIGSGASSSAVDQITLGHTDQTVRISSTYTLPTSDGTSGQVLTTNGSGAVTFADAGGGADLYAANESSPAAQPSATGANAVAIGDSATATAAHDVAIGLNANATAQSNSPALAMGKDADASSGGISIGNYGSATGTYATALGTSADATAINASALGNDAKSTASDAVALGKSRASGGYSFAAAIANNTSSYGATGTNSVAIGANAKATGLRAMAIGYEAQATHTSTVAIGANSRATVTYAMAFGNDANGAKMNSIAIGTRSYTRAVGHIAFGTGSLVSHGYAQSGMMVIHGRTADATQGALVSDSSLQGMGTPGSSYSANQLQVPSYGAIAFDGMIVARGQGSASNTDSAAWKVEGLIRRENAASTTVLVNHVISTISNSPNWGITLSADTTNGALSVLVTGQASTNVKWVCTLRSSETVYNTY